MTVRPRHRLTRTEVAALPAGPKLREIDFQRQLVGTKPPGLAVILGWEHVHFRPAMTKHGWRTAGTGSMALGWPDLVLVRARDRRLIFAELKADGARPTPEQERVLAILGALAFDPTAYYSLVPRNWRTPAEAPTVEVYLWRPSDWPEIERVLR